MIAGTHTHAVPGGYWHYGADTPLGSPFYPEFFEAMTEGIAASIVAAHEDLKPGRILIAAGEVEGGGAQRSRAAYMLNPEEERRAYPTDIDTRMTLVKFVVDGKPVGILNWHAVHPTSMSFNNKLISSDNKGYAAYALERQLNRAGQGGAENFVAAFAQSNCGDVTPHLDLKGVGPGKDEFDGTRIMGGRQVDAATRLMAAASEPVSGPVDSRQVYVDMGRLAVRDEFTHAGTQTTSPPAYGYSFAAGSTEDGGGQPMFREGMTQEDPFIQALARAILPLPPAGAELRRGHRPKPILLALGAVDPPALPQVLPISVARIGQLVLVVGPAEFTTMSGRRFRRSVMKQIPEAKYVVIAGYANDYAGYVATREEYEAQHYEGAATLYGPWTQAAYEQEFTRLAADLEAGRPSESHEPPLEMRGRVRPTPLATAYDREPTDAKYGDVASQVESAYKPGERVTVSFSSGNPQNGYRAGRRYAAIERLSEGQWVTACRDGDWEVKCRWTQPRSDAKGAERRLAAHLFTVEWEVPADVEPGSYRITHFGGYKAQGDGQVHPFEASSRTFEVR